MIYTIDGRRHAIQKGGGGTPQRFGVSGEDDIAGEDRYFDADQHAVSVSNATTIGLTADGTDYSSYVNIQESQSQLISYNKNNLDLAEIVAADDLATGPFIRISSRIDKGGGSYGTMFEIKRDTMFHIYNGSGRLSPRVSSMAGYRAVLRDTVTGALVDYTGSIGGGGTPIANVGSGYRPVKPASQEVKTLFPQGSLEIDSTSNTNGLTFSFENTDVKAFQALCATVKAETVALSALYATRSVALTDGQIRYIPVYLSKGQTLTGVKVFMKTAGSYTGDNNNRVGLYSYSGGVLTQVASSTNNANLWTATANTYNNIAFSSTYDAPAGMYYVALIYNNSSQSTAPAIAASAADYSNANQTDPGFTNSAKLHGFVSSQTDIPGTTVNMSTISSSSTAYYVALY